MVQETNEFVDTDFCNCGTVMVFFDYFIEIWMQIAFHCKWSSMAKSLQPLCIGC